MSIDFDMKEFEELRTEVRDILNSIYLVGRSVLFASAAIFSWFATSSVQHSTGGPTCLLSPNQIVTLTLFIPVMLTLFALFYFINRVSFVEQIGQYIKNKHEVLYATGSKGWEHYSTRARNVFGLRPPLAVALGWSITLAANLTAALLLRANLVELPPCS